MKTSPIRAAAVGALLALVLGLLLVGGFFALRFVRPSTARMLDKPDRVFVVFSVRGEDGAPVAGAIADVGSDPAAITFVDTSQTVNIPGTTYSRLADAYAFGGASAVVSALEGGRSTGSIGWIDVPEAGWQKLFPRGLAMTLPERFDVFDGSRFKTFEEGTQTVEARDLRMLVNGLAYLPKAERRQVLEELTLDSLAVLSRTPKATGAITSDLSSSGWASFSSRLRQVLPRDPVSRP